MNSVLSEPLDATEPDPLRRVLHVAWLGIGLGLVLEMLLLATQAWSGKLPTGAGMVADTLQKVSWSSLVCIALAAGQTIRRLQTAAMGLAGLFGAPIAFLTARSVHQSATQVLSGGAAAAGAGVPWLLVGLRGLEYAVLGLLLAWLGQRRAGSRAYMLAGAGVGIVFGACILWLTGGDAIKAINEVLFPLGCALVIYAGGALATRLESRQGPASRPG